MNLFNKTKRCMNCNKKAVDYIRDQSTGQMIRFCSLDCASQIKKDKIAGGLSISDHITSIYNFISSIVVVIIMILVFIIILLRVSF